MMSKKDYQLFADALSQIESEEKQEEMIDFLYPIFKADNYKFDLDRFRDWIKRRKNKESMKGTNYNPKNMSLGVD